MRGGTAAGGEAWRSGVPPKEILLGDEENCTGASSGPSAPDARGRSTRGRVHGKEIHPFVASSLVVVDMGEVTMHITAADDALDRARSQGFIEAVFAPMDADAIPVERDHCSHPVAIWGSECEAEGRHSVIVGQLPEAHFVMVILRDRPP